jgi:NADH-quinone oxidoreductase subunit J
MVLILFVIMLLNPMLLEQRRVGWQVAGAVAALLLVFLFIRLFVKAPAPATGAPPPSFGSPELLARTLFTDFVLPFEIASVLLLVAIIGAVVLAKREA